MIRYIGGRTGSIGSFRVVAIVGAAVVVVVVGGFVKIYMAVVGSNFVRAADDANSCGECAKMTCGAVGVG